MKKILEKLSSVLTPDEKRNARILILILVMSAAFELAGIVSVLPYVNLVLNPELLRESKSLVFLTQNLNIKDDQIALMVVGCLCLALFTLGTIFKILSNFLILKFSHTRNHAIAERLLASYFSLDFEEFTTRHTSDYLKVILTEVTQVTSAVLMPLLNLIAHGLVVVLITGFLVIINPLVAVMVLCTLPAAYLVTYWLIKDKLVQLGQTRDMANAERYASLSEAVNGIRDLKLGARHPEFLKRFSSSSLKYARAIYLSQSLVLLPKYILELLIFGGMLVGILVLLNDPQTLATYMPVVAVYAFSGYRLLPSAQILYGVFSNLKFSLPALDNVSSNKGLDKALAHVPRSNTDYSEVQFDERIDVEALSFKFKGSDELVLADVNFTINRGEVIGVVGPSGSGKSTLIDLLLGLLTPTQGSIYLDNIKLSSEKVEAWQRCISYVPQTIYLLDDSFTNNIAFGAPSSEVDFERVLGVSRIARIDEFIEASAENGFDTHIGERGVRLSGGQRQRLGIARALYATSQVLVLDEATSALDSATESEIIDSVLNTFAGNTIIMIAHRISTLKRCDKILEVKNGRVRWLTRSEISLLS